MCALAHLTLSLGWITTRGCEGVVAFFSRISRYPWLKGFLLLKLGAGVLLSCVAWDVGTSACFHTLQDLLGRPVRTRRCVWCSTFVEEIFAFCYTMTGFGQVLGNGVGGTIGV